MLLGSFRRRSHIAARTTWPAMSGNGAVTTTIRQSKRMTTLAAFCVAARGAIKQTTAVPRFATLGDPTSVATTSVSVWRELYSLSACAFTACCVTAFLLYLRGEERAAPKFYWSRRMDIHVRRMAMKHGRSEGYCALTVVRQCDDSRPISRTGMSKVQESQHFAQGISVGGATELRSRCRSATRMPGNELLRLA